MSGGVQHNEFLSRSSGQLRIPIGMENTPEQRRQALVFALTRAHGREDLVELTHMLGLEGELYVLARSRATATPTGEQELIDAGDVDGLLRWVLDHQPAPGGVS